VLSLVAPDAFAHAPQAELPHAGAHSGHGAGHPSAKINWFSLNYKGGCLGKDNAHDYPPIGLAIINFALLVFLLVKFARRPLQDYLQQRHERIKNELEEATTLRRKAADQLARVSARLANLDLEIAEIKEGVARDAQEERLRLISSAEKEAERIIEMAEKTMSRELARAKRKLETEAASAAMAAAESILKQQLTDADRRRVYAEYISQLKEGSN
jgi:F-type H+-transporting ATPase subunit b